MSLIKYVYNPKCTQTLQYKHYNILGIINFLEISIIQANLFHLKTPLRRDWTDEKIIDLKLLDYFNINLLTVNRVLKVQMGMHVKSLVEPY